MQASQPIQCNSTELDFTLTKSRYNETSVEHAWHSRYWNKNEKQVLYTFPDIKFVKANNRRFVDLCISEQWCVRVFALTVWEMYWWRNKIAARYRLDAGRDNLLDGTKQDHESSCVQEAPAVMFSAVRAIWCSRSAMKSPSASPYLVTRPKQGGARFQSSSPATGW